jgi:DNA-binding transcriptional ArsR family regulator
MNQTREMQLEEAAQGFAAVGSEPRLEVLLALVKAGHQGLSIGTIGERLGIPLSTLAHHMRYLETAGLISQKKKGRSVINSANYSQLEALASYLLHECCDDENGEESR